MYICIYTRSYLKLVEIKIGAGITTGGPFSTILYAIEYYHIYILCYKSTSISICVYTKKGIKKNTLKKLLVVMSALYKCFCSLYATNKKLQYHAHSIY